ncbi:MAG: cell division protein FtsZ, partial [Rhodospirillales bacterium]
TLIVIPNQNLFLIANPDTTFKDAFKMADEVLQQGVRGITDLMVMPGLINLDFADVRSVMAGMGKAMMGTGEAEGERRALDAAEAAISNPLLDDSSMQGARGVLINITGGPDMTLFEVDEAANRIRAEVDQDAYIIFGSTFDERMEGTMRVSVVATGIESAEQRAGLPVGAIVTEARAKPATKPVVRPVQAAPAAPEVKAAPVEAVKAEAKPEPEAPKVEAPKVEVSKAEAVEPVAEARPVFSRPEPVAEAEPELDVEEEITEVATPVAETESDADADAVKAASVQVEPVATQPAFIPPEPVRPASAAPASVAPAEPFAAAALANASEARPEPAAVEAPITPKGGRRLSLFERVTGIGGKKEASGTEAIDPLPFQSAAPAPVAPKPMPPKPMAPAQSALGGLTQAEQLPESQEQDDLLEIPAFLRRQAN